MVYETWIGPTYMSGLAGELGLDLKFVVFLAALPWLGAIGQIIGPWSLERISSVKKYTLFVAGFGRALWILPLGAAFFLDAHARHSGTHFNLHLWFLAVIGTACTSSLLTSISATSWLAWMKAIVPGRFQGRFFACRQRYTTLAFAIASLLGSFLMGWSPHGYRAGIACLGLLAVVSGGISIAFLARVPGGIPHKLDQPSTFKETIRRPLRDPEFRKLLWFGAAFNGATQVASSYFPYYFTKNLGLPLSWVALWGGLLNLGCFLAAPFWGRRVDRLNCPYRVFWYAGHAISLSPLFYYLVRSASAIAWMAPLDYFVSGIFSSGFVLAQTALLIRLSPKGKAASYFSLYAAICGLSGALGTCLGGGLAEAFALSGGFRSVFLISFGLRFLALYCFCRPRLPDLAWPMPPLKIKFLIRN
jgi:MFS family permease